jgi:hypothetical protein
VLGDVSSSRRGLIPPSVFLQALETNSVVLIRSEARLLLWQFQEPNGAVAASKFLRWMALSAPGDHVDPDLMFPQLPQPYRRIQKVLDHDIFDAAWAGEGRTRCSRPDRGADKSQNPLHQQRNDHDTAKRRSCEPTRHIPLDSSAQRVAGLASHCLLSVVVAAVNTEAQDSAPNSPPLLRVVSTADANGRALGDFSVSYPLEAPVPADDADAVTTTHTSIKKLSALQLGTDGNGCLAAHLEETTRAEAAHLDPNADVQPPAPTTRECVGVYSVRVGGPQAPDRDDSPCELIAVISPPQASSIASIVLSQDSAFLAVTWVGSKTVALYGLRHEEHTQETEAGLQPLMLSIPAVQVDLEAARSPFLEDEGAPVLHFLVAPPTRSSPRAAPTTYAFALCYGLKVLKYVLPSASSSTAAPTLLTPAKSWEHLTNITASAQDLTTQYLVTGCQDGTIVVWDVLRDIDYAFLSPEREQAKAPASPTEISNVLFCQAGYVVALSQPQQRLCFFDVRRRGKPALTRVVSPPPASSQSGISMTNLAASTAAADIPVALVEYSNGMVLLYDVRVAEAIGSLRTALPGPVASASSAETTSIVGNQETLATAATSEAAVHLYSWRDVLLTSVPSISTTLGQRQDELVRRQLSSSFLASVAHLFSLRRPARTSSNCSHQAKTQQLLLRLHHQPSQLQAPPSISSKPCS